MQSTGNSSQDKENTSNKMMNSQFLSTSSEFNEVEKAHIGRKERELICENINTSFDEAFLVQDSFDSLRVSSSIDAEIRPSISESVFLMNSYSMDEFNQVHNITKKIGKPVLLSLEKPSAVKALKASWVLTSPSDKNMYLSPSKTLKRKYKSRSNEELFEDGF